MRLTKIHKQAIVAAVMLDVPNTLEATQDAWRNFVHEEMYKDAEKISPLLARGLQDPTVLPFLLSNYSTVYDPYHSGLNGISAYRGFALNERAIKIAKVMSDVYSAERLRMNELQSNVAAAVEGCATRKVALERLPEFKKYLPEDVTAVKTDFLPAIANLAANLAKAGWPKGAVAA